MKLFRKNRRLEAKIKLPGTPRYIINKALNKYNLTFLEREFLFFALTLFSEARNSAPEDIAYVAKVINNRRGNNTYEATVTKLAQFSGWYYKNRYDNIALLCPSKLHKDNWTKVIKVAYAHFHKKDPEFTSKYYFAPKNMYPKYKVPQWAKNKYGIVHGGHVFLISKAEAKRIPSSIYINKSHLRIK